MEVAAHKCPGRFRDEIWQGHRLPPLIQANLVSTQLKPAARRFRAERREDDVPVERTLRGVAAVVDLCMISPKTQGGVSGMVPEEDSLWVCCGYVAEPVSPSSWYQTPKQSGRSLLQSERPLEESALRRRVQRYEDDAPWYRA